VEMSREVSSGRTLYVRVNFIGMAPAQSTILPAREVVSLRTPPGRRFGAHAPRRELNRHLAPLDSKISTCARGLCSVHRSIFAMRGRLNAAQIYDGSVHPKAQRIGTGKIAWRSSIPKNHFAENSAAKSRVASD